MPFPAPIDSRIRGIMSAFVQPGQSSADWAASGALKPVPEGEARAVLKQDYKHMGLPTTGRTSRSNDEDGAVWNRIAQERQRGIAGDPPLRRKTARLLRYPSLSSIPHGIGGCEVRLGLPPLLGLASWNTWRMAE